MREYDEITIIFIHARIHFTLFWNLYQYLLIKKIYKSSKTVLLMFIK